MTKLDKTDFEICRRGFLQTSGTLGAGMCVGFARTAKAQTTGRIPFAQWKPCIDVLIEAEENRNRSKRDVHDSPPVRSRLLDPITQTDEALIEENPGLARQLAANVQAAQAQSAQSANRGSAVTQRLGLPSSAPAQFAALNRWREKELRVYFYAGDTPLAARVLNIASEWSKYALIDFKPVDNVLDADIRVSFSGRGHWSYIGPQSRDVGGQSMNLQFGAADRIQDADAKYGIVLHEFGHALGVIHEHLSPRAGRLFNEDAVLRYYARVFGWDANKTRLNVLNRYNDSQLLRDFVSDFDRQSIMLYENPPELTLDGRGTPHNTVLSSIDKQYIARLYQGRTTAIRDDDPDPEPTVPNDQEINVGANPVAGALTPTAGESIFRFTADEAATYKIQTYGYTKVWVTLETEGGTGIEFERGSKDLVNIWGYPKLSAGKHVLKVRHWYQNKGTGEFSVQITKVN